MLSLKSLLFFLAFSLSLLYLLPSLNLFLSFFIFFFNLSLFLDAIKAPLCPVVSVHRFVGWSVTQTFEDELGAPIDL